MPRQLRRQYPGALYHIMSRGNRRANIFLDDVDRQDFLKTLAEPKGQRIIAEELGRHGWQEADLASLRRSHPAKLQITAPLRKETTLTIKRISTRLHLGTPRSASVRLHIAMKETHQPTQAGLET